MCLPPEKYVEVKVYTRLVERGVNPERALGVARKIRHRYHEQRKARLAALREEA